jgi:hypothetical protein
MRGLALLVCMLLSGLDFPPFRPAHRHEVCPGATYFYEIGTPRPRWASHMTIACVIGHHVFLAPSPRTKA